MANNDDGFKDKDSFLDALFDFIFEGDDDVEDEDQKWFEERVAAFFSDKENEGGSGSGASAPRRRRPASSGTGPRRRRRASAGSGESRYGSRAFWGN
jgi:hypothetical protein